MERNRELPASSSTPTHNPPKYLSLSPYHSAPLYSSFPPRPPPPLKHSLLLLLLTPLTYIFSEFSLTTARLPPYLYYPPYPPSSTAAVALFGLSVTIPPSPPAPTAPGLIFSTGGGAWVQLLPIPLPRSLPLLLLRHKHRLLIPSKDGCDLTSCVRP